MHIDTATPSTAGFAVEIDHVSETEWNVLIDDFADASVYQTWAYGAARWGRKQLSHLLLRRDGVAAALAQLRVIEVPALRAGIAYVRWGPMCTRKNTAWDPVIWRAMLDALTSEYVKRRGLTLRMLPSMFLEDSAASVASAITSEAGFVQVDDQNAYRSLRVDLRPSLEAMRSRLAHKWRNQLNASERNELEICEGSTDALYQEFARLYHEMMARKRFDTTVSIVEFARMQQQLPEDQKLIILIARKDRLALSGVVASTIGSTGIYLLGATGDAGMKLKSSYLLQWHMMKRLKQMGCHWYDLGGINAATNPGVYHFKLGMGGDEVVHVGRYDSHGNALTKFALQAAERLRLIPA